jgi:alpha-D-xyloside xylohydrolase
MLDLMIYEGMGAPGKEYEHDNVMLGRSGWAGSQRFGGAVWSGDTKSTWEDFNQQFRAGLNMVMSGIPYWTTDIGGFGGGHTQSADFRELVVRWFQWGAFCPLFRLHGARSGPTWPPGGAGACGQAASNEVWMFGSESEAAIVKVMRMREQLRPYVMEQYRAAAASGTPIMRPLFFDFHTDATSQGIDDQQMFVSGRERERERRHCRPWRWWFHNDCKLTRILFLDLASAGPGLPRGPGARAGRDRRGRPEAVKRPQRFPM